MEQLILHLTGDYLLQSDWMALNKIKNSRAAATHALVYSLPFLLLQPSWTAWFVIFFTHFLIDRFALAKYIAPKGSVSLNGTSLTVNEVEGAVFGINFIPHTKAVTIWSDAKVDDLVNLEIDTLARYVARLQDWK